MKDQINLSDKSKISMPIANLIMVIALVASTVFGYSALTNRITALETQDTLMTSDLLKKAQQEPKNLEIFMLIEHNAKILEKHQELLDENIHSQVMIKNLEKDLEEAEDKIEYLLNLTRKLNGNSN
jgi:hypothetical protein|tara:strand:+ start:411 stop:788 length:378 start_codon:yes stop_codon:yes gene_type:complete